ncbi:MAG TPA: hypothetical protein VF484_09275, partial [Candidatus Limnocylindrales bacterium]
MTTSARAGRRSFRLTAAVLAAILAASLEVTPAAAAILPVSITTSFTVATIHLNGSTTLTFSIHNPNPLSSQTLIAFSSTLPAGLVITDAPQNTCGGTASNGTDSITLVNGSLAANASCAVSMTVQGTTLGSKDVS